MISLTILRDLAFFFFFFFGETWLNKNDSSNFDIDGYCCEHVFASKSLGTTKGRFSGGISVYYFKTELKDYVTVAENK